MGIASKRLYCAKQMPELKHNVGEGKFDIKKSEVVQWLINQPEILQYVFNRMSDGGEKALIVYNPERGTWQGVDYGKD